MPLLEVKNLTTVFRGEKEDIIAVDDVSFSIGRGETVGLVGESGCGKSVTSLSIMRLVEHAGGRIKSGEIIFDGADLLKLKSRDMRRINGNRISMIFQDPMSSLNPMLTIGTQITETIRRHDKTDRHEARARALRMLEAVGLNDVDNLMKSYPGRLSGGQRQRVMIAISLCCRPDLLIADEPTTALDVTIQAQILDLLKELKDEFGMSMLLITHDLGVVADMAQRVIVMYGGQVVEQGGVMDIFENPRHPYTKGLLKSIPRLKDTGERLYMIPGFLPKPEEYPTGCRFSGRCEYSRAVCSELMPPLAGSEGHQWRCLIETEAYENSGKQ